MTVDLGFLAQQQTHILAELAEMRLQFHTDTMAVRDDLSVLTAMVLRIENSNRNHREFVTHVLDRIRKLEASPT